ncbi:polyphosphate kinase 2 family protein [Nocardioides jensenii]|uniref:polyphosphate kinase 2 family protein n=1 Tax=Nocardioides jensenii TaxID=1843 RepID=UPI00083741C4|nr:polyphosphate kinase 2 family protein [Nocardioides jensenii]
MSKNESFHDLLRVPGGRVDLDEIDPEGKPGFDGDKSAGETVLEEMGPGLADLQERLFAARSAGDERRLLLVLQGMDTSGKGGVLRHTVGLVDPQGVRITSFKAPSKEELEHDFLWRIRKAVPEPGFVGVFDRSHYEDVLIGRVRELVAPEEIENRYDAINAFEQELVDDGVTIIKCMLHISADEQKKRLQARLDDPTKYWKFNPGDIDERELWPAYQRAYELAIERTNTEAAPWHVVPANRKWFRNLAVAHLLREAFEALDLEWPEPDFDIEEQKKRLDDEALIA